MPPHASMMHVDQGLQSLCLQLTCALSLCCLFFSRPRTQAGKEEDSGPGDMRCFAAPTIREEVVKSYLE